MESIGTGEWIAIVVVGCIIGVLIGYWLGSMTGRQHARDVQQSRREQNDYRAEVREHFQEISTIMTRMAGDYREMYQHVARHAEQLADVHPEHLIDLPPAPETITDQRSEADREADRGEGDRPAPHSASRSTGATTGGTADSRSRAAAQDETAEEPGYSQAQAYEATTGHEQDGRNGADSTAAAGDERPDGVRADDAARNREAAAREAAAASSQEEQRTSGQR